MKANRKFLNGANDEAVSPVIAVILMVAITVVLAATVYVWVSGFSGGGAAQKSIALTSDGPIPTTGTFAGEKTYTIASSTSGMKWEDLKITLDGTTLALDVAPNTCAAASGANAYQACGPTLELGTATVDAGDYIRFTATSGQTLRVLDANANAVIYTVTVS